MPDDAITFEEATLQEPDVLSWEVAHGQRLRQELSVLRQEPAALSSPNAPAPTPVSTFQGASETTLMPAGEEYRQFRLPRAGVLGISPVTTFQGPSEVTLQPEQQARTTGEVMQNAAAASIEGIVSPMTPPLILGTVAAPQVAIPLLTATMAKSGSKKLAEGLVDLQQGRHEEGVAKVGEATTELGFAAAPGLHPRAYTRPTEAPAPTVLRPEPLQPFLNARVQPGERAGVPVPTAGAEMTVPAPRKPVVEHLTPEEQAQAQQQIAEEVPAAQPVEAPAPAEPTPVAPVEAPALRGAKLNKAFQERYSALDADARANALSEAGVDAYEDGKFLVREREGNLSTLKGDALVEAKREFLRLTEPKVAAPVEEPVAEAAQPDAKPAEPEAPAAKTGEEPYVRTTVQPSGVPVRDVPVLRADIRETTPEPWKMTREEMGQRARDEAAASPSLPEAPPDLYATLKALSDRNNRKPYNPDLLTPERMGLLGDEDLITGSPTRAKITQEGFAKLNEWERMNREREMKLGDLSDELVDKAMDEHKASVAKAVREGRPVSPEILSDYPDLAKPAEAKPAPKPPAPAPGPALTLLGLTEDKFALPALRKLSRDTIRRLANSLGTDATVPAVARRAAERFDEMRKQPPGPVGMGGALAAEMSGTDAPLAGTPAHAVETGPPSERPLGLTDPASAPFVSLSLELLGQPSRVPPEYSVDTGLKSLAGASAPRLTAMNRPAGEALVRYAASKIAAPYKALAFSGRVLDTGVNPIKFGAALVEDNLRSIEQEFLRRSNEATDQATANDFYERALNVRSIVGGKNSPFKTEQEYQDFLHDPVTQEAVKRHVQLWQEDIEPQYKMAQSLDPDLELPTRGQQTGARINLKAILEGDEPGTRPVTASRGGLTASFKRKSPFAREAKGTGDVYESNYPDIIANTYRRQLEIANQNEMNRVLVANDLARIDKPGARVMFGNKPGVPFPLSRRLILTGGEAIPAGQNIYVRPEFAREYRTALNTDTPQRIPFFTDFSKRFTVAALAGITDASIHLSNLATALFTRPNSPLLWDSLAKATGRLDVPITITRVLIKAAADNRKQLAEIAEIGGMREAFPNTDPSNIVGKVVHFPAKVSQRIIAWADRTTRLVLDDAYKGLVEQGIVEGTETARREFINQVGQYNKRLQGAFTVLLRDTGIGPFVTAGKTFNALGIRNMLLSPGLKAVSPGAAAALRGNALAGWVGFVTLTATLNYLLTRNKGGGMMGRPGVPLGNVDVGTEDKQGRPNSLPLGDILGYTRGLRATGTRRLLEAKRSGIGTNQAIDSALGDVVNTAVSPAIGPLLRSGFAAVTGRPPALNVGRSAPVVGPEQSQFAANVMDALRKVNPAVNSAFDMREGKTWWDALHAQAPRLTTQAGMTESKAAAMPRIVERARLNDFIDDLARRSRRLPRGERLSFLRDEINKAELSGADRITAFRKVRSTLKYE